MKRGAIAPLGGTPTPREALADVKLQYQSWVGFR